MDALQTNYVVRRLVPAMEGVVMIQLLLLQTGVEYSNVLQMNAIRHAGLVCACVNGFYALYVLQHYSDAPGGGPTCATSSTALRLPLGESESSSGSGSSTGSALQTRLVADYTTFILLLVVNLLCLGYGVSSVPRYHARVAR